MSEAKQSVVILYEHALLGEGIAKYLRAHSGVEARVVPGNDLAAVTSALAFGPTVVIFELSEPLRDFDLSALAPHAVLIDVSAVVTRGLSVTPDAAGLERLLQAVSGPAAPPIPLADEVSLPAESCLRGILAAPAR
jgi:hypothetical protein